MDDLAYRQITDGLDVVSQCIWVLNPQGQVIRANRSAFELTGLTKQVIEGLPFWQLPWRSLTLKTRRSFQKAIHSSTPGLVAEIEFKERGNGKKARIFSFRFKPFFPKDNEYHLLIVEGRDITTFHRANEALYQSEARFKAIYEASGIGIVIKARNGAMLDCNPAFEKMVGYPSAELRKHDYLEITHLADRRASRRLFLELVNEKRASYSLEKRYLHKNGQIVWVKMNASAVRSQSGEIQFVVGMVEDITANRMMEEELSEVKHRLMDNIDKERLRLAQDLHDGPLQEIIGVSFQLSEVEKNLDDGKSVEQLQAIRAAVQKLIQSVRTISGELRPPALVPFGLEKSILSHMESWKQAHPEMNVSVKLAHDGLLLPENVRFVLYRIYQEALNNILRHSRARSVTIKFRLTKLNAILVIEDDGIGFELPRHWIVLVREGHLGLVGAMERVRDIGGNLEIITSPGRGTRIQVTVPISRSLDINESSL